MVLIWSMLFWTTLIVWVIGALADLEATLMSHTGF
jgi:hypothetical protein